MAPLSFSDPSTHFAIVTSDTPVSVDGLALNEPTGEIHCEACGAQHLNVDEIPHAQDCPQRFVRSRWWRDQMRRD